MPRIIKYPKIYGIYKIHNLVDNKVYIGGCAADRGVYNRLRLHKKKLSRNDHHNKHLQAAWNKYGGENFSFELLEENYSDIVWEREEFYIKIFDSIENGYNIVTTENGKVKRGPDRLIEITSPEGNLVKEIGIKKFCEKYDLNYRGISRLITGKTKKYKEWHSVKIYDAYGQEISDIRNKEYFLVNPNGEIEKFTNILAYCQERNLVVLGVQKVLDGRNVSHKGYTSVNRKQRENQRVKGKIILSPDGKKYFVRSLRHFSKALGISESILYSLTANYNKKTENKGWKFLGFTPNYAINENTSFHVIEE